MGMEGKIAIVTGGSRGIGRAISEELAKRGANIIVADIQEELAKTTAQEITDSNGRESIGVYVDVADLESAKAMVDHVKEQFGRVDILVNNAGVTRDNLIMRMSEEDCDMVLNVNLKGAFSCTKAVIRPMMKQRFGRIINISSLAARGLGVVGPHYAASKAGMLGMTMYAARQLGEHGITVNAIAPAFIEDAGIFKDWSQEKRDELKGKIVVPEIGNVNDVVLAFDYLMDSSFVTGVTLDVNGGAFMI